MIKGFLEWLVIQMYKESTYQQFAEFVLKIASILFKDLTEFIESQVERFQKRIDKAKEDGEPEEVIQQMKHDAGQVVDKITVRQFSESPTFVPGFVRRAIRDAKAYLLNHPTDPRNDKARSKGFFRQHDTEELKDTVDRILNG